MSTAHIKAMLRIRKTDIIVDVLIPPCTKKKLPADARLQWGNVRRQAGDERSHC